jgi:hypothetical protein
MGIYNKISRYWMFAVIPILIVIFYFIATRIVNSMDYHHNDNDFFTFWLAGKLAGQGQSPYAATLWVAGYQQFQMDIIPNPGFLYPLPMALLFTPLGLLPFHTAYVIWVTLLQVLILASLMVLSHLEVNSKIKLIFIPLVVGVIFFRPTILTLTQGQVSGFFLFIIVGMAWLGQKEKWFLSGLLLGMLVLKPNLGLIIIALLAVWLIYQKRWMALLGISFSGIFLLIAGLLFDPRWVSEYWQVGSNKLSQTFGGSPTVWGLSALIFHNETAGTLVTGSLAALLCLLVFLMLVLRSGVNKRPLVIIGLAVTVTLLVTPYTWTYDQILLLIPITGITFAMNQKFPRSIFSFTLFIFIDFLAFLLLFPDSMLHIEILNAIIPLSILCLCIWQVFSLTRAQKGRRKRGIEARE